MGVGVGGSGQVLVARYATSVTLCYVHLHIAAKSNTSHCELASATFPVADAVHVPVSTVYTSDTKINVLLDL